ncbi:glycosyltransferase [Lithospermum erythrorhizon]
MVPAPGNILKSRRPWQRLLHTPVHHLSSHVPILLAVLLILSLILLGGWSSVKLPEFGQQQITGVQFHQALTNWNSTNSINKDLGLNASSLINRISTLEKDQGPGATSLRNKSPTIHEVRSLEAASQLPQKGKSDDEPYHNWELFDSEYQEMLRKLKIFVYPDAFIHNHNQSSPFAEIFLPHPNPYDPKLGNYFSEHAFKITLLESPLITTHPEEAQFFFLPFSINAMRNHPRLHSESSIPDFIAQYTTRISTEFRYWNASGGADHFYICCHSVGREAASKHHALYNNAIQVTCSSSYFQRLYVTHKDVGLPQVWPRRAEQKLNPPNERTKLAFFAGRVQNSRVRKTLLDFWNNDPSFDISSKSSSLTYEERFRRSKFCLHVRGYEVNTARISDALHYGCIPVIISNYYDLPFADVLDWNKFSLIVSHEDIANLKSILLSVSDQMYLRLFQNLCIARRHFVWHKIPESYDSFYMTAYQLWRRRGLQHLSY